MARPRKILPLSDPFSDLAKKTEILEREMNVQRAALERLKQFSKIRPRPLRVDETQEVIPAIKRRVAR